MDSDRGRSAAEQEGSGPGSLPPGHTVTWHLPPGLRGTLGRPEEGASRDATKELGGRRQEGQRVQKSEPPSPPRSYVPWFGENWEVRLVPRFAQGWGEQGRVGPSLQL